LLPVSASLNCCGNPGPHIGYTLRQARKSHSVQISRASRLLQFSRSLYVPPLSRGGIRR
jgi:hypothetical protein